MKTFNFRAGIFNHFTCQSETNLNRTFTRIITDTENSDVLNSVDTQISDIKFTNLGNKLTNLGNPGKSTIQVSFTLTSKMIKNTGPEVESFKTTVGLR